MNRIRIDPGKWSTPYHRHGARGGDLLRARRLGRVASRTRLPTPSAPAIASCTALRRGAHAPRRRRRARRPHVRRDPCYAPRSAIWLARRRRWIAARAGSAADDHPWKREVAAGEPEVTELVERPGNVVNRDDVEGGARRPRKRAGRAGRGRAPGLTGAGLVTRARTRRRTATPRRRRSSSCSRARASSSSGRTRSDAVELAYEGTRSAPGSVRLTARRDRISHGLRAAERGHDLLRLRHPRPERTPATTRGRARSTFRGLGVIARLERPRLRRRGAAVG